jgi:hypothetical protein
VAFLTQTLGRGAVSIVGTSAKPVSPTLTPEDRLRMLPVETGGLAMISVLIAVLIIVVIGAICFWAIDRFASDRRLANLLKLLVVLICLGAILQRVLPLAGIY